MKIDCPLSAVAIGLTVLTVGCQSIDSSIFGGSFGRNSSAMVGGGAVAGQDYVIGLKPSEAAQQYFASASASDAKAVTVTPGDDKGTGVTWTDDGGIMIPPGTTIEFTNKGCCLDPHLPAPKADEEMQFIKTSCLIPTQLQGTYKNLLRRAAAGDEDVKVNIQHLMWTLRTAGSNDAYAKNLTDRQREILAECAEAGSFDGYCQDLHRYDWLKKLVKDQVSQVAEQLQIEVGNVTYKASDLLDPEIGKQKVAAHLGELIHMNEYLPVVHSGFNYGELEKGVYTDIKGNGTLSFKAKVANSTSEPFVFYPMDYVAQVGSGQNMQGAFFAAADSSMKQRQTEDVPNEVEAKEDKKHCEHDWVSQCINSRPIRLEYEREITQERNRLIEKVRNMDRDPDYEYGAIIYLQDGKVQSTEIVKGFIDYDVVPYGNISMGILLGMIGSEKANDYATPAGRVAEREENGQKIYYAYDKNNNVDYSTAYDSPNGPFSGYPFKQSSWPAVSEIRKLPNDAIPLEIYHDHPDGSGFSEQDKIVARREGVNISISNDLYRPDIRYVCSKCGATR